MIKKRYIVSVLGVLFLLVYGGMLLHGPRGVRAGLLGSAAERTAAAALDRWTALSQARRDAGGAAATREALARMQRALAVHTGSSAGAPLEEEEGGGGSSAGGSAVQQPAGGSTAAAPLNMVLLAAPGLDEVDLWTSLASIAASAPDCVVLLIVNPEQAAALAPSVLAPDAAAPSGGARDPSKQASWRAEPARAPLRLWLRMYSWPALDALLAPEHRRLLPPIRRYAMYPLLLADVEAGGAGGGAAAAVLSSNLDAPRLRAPLGVLISDARDMVFQLDPFPALWRQLGGATPAAAASRAVVVAGEAEVRRVGEDDWNRGWVSFCYYDLGEAMVGEEYIYCSGTTFATLPGMRHYLLEGMLPAMAHCAVIDWEKVRAACCRLRPAPPCAALPPTPMPHRFFLPHTRFPLLAHKTLPGRVWTRAYTMC